MDQLFTPKPVVTRRRLIDVSASKKSAWQTRVGDYIQLIKPGITLSNLLPCFAGYWLGSKGHPSLAMWWVLLGTALVIAGSCVLNNCIDRDIDGLMTRTRNRAIPAGRIPVKQALLYGLIVSATGLFTLYIFIHPLAFWLATAGVGIYVVLYSLWLKRCSTSNTVIGSLSGAVPPLLGWSAATGGLEEMGWILFGLLFVWQPAHFFALAMLKKEEYRQAGIPMLPVMKGNPRTKWHMLGWVAVLGVVSVFLSDSKWLYEGFGLTAWLLGGGYLVLSLSGWVLKDEQKWARWMFRYSLIYLTGILTAMVLFTL